MPYVRCPEEWSYQAKLSKVVDKVVNADAKRSFPPSLEFVCFRRPFDQLYWLRRRDRWISDTLTECRLRRRGGHLVMWHNVEYHDVPPKRRNALYMDKSPILGERYDVPDGLCIPTPPVFACYSHICVDRLQKGVEALFIDTIGLSEWVVQVVMAFVAVAYDGVKYYARCRDSRLYHSVANDPNRGRLFRLPGDVMSLARTMGLDKMMEGCETTAVQVEELFAHVEMIDWEAHGCDFVWFN